jgi:hypothetical protein
MVHSWCRIPSSCIFTDSIAVLRGFGYFAVNPNELDNLKDTTYMLAAGGVAIAHDLLGG